MALPKVLPYTVAETEVGSMRIQQTSRLINISVVVLSALVARQIRFSQERAYERREALVTSKDLLA